MEFIKWPKIPRMKRDIIITEKIDGTNAQVYIVDKDIENEVSNYVLSKDGDKLMFAGSRNRWVTAAKDNYGFAKWVIQNAEELFKLGYGRHYGEWWGQGIQRRYDMEEKVFSLFNTHRWHMVPEAYRPECVSCVPVLYEGPWNQDEVDNALNWLRTDGSVAAPGFYDPEGIVLFHKASNSMYKITLKNDGVPKGNPNA